MPTSTQDFEDWEKARLKIHSRRKLRILSEYFSAHLITRTQLPLVSEFKIAVVDAFAGGGKYTRDHNDLPINELGSPLIFIEQLGKTMAKIAALRLNKSIKNPVSIKCLLILNDESKEAIDILRNNVYLAKEEYTNSNPYIDIETIFFNDQFENIYPEIKALINGKYINPFFNLDQFGWSKVTIPTISDILTSFGKAEILLNFSLKSFTQYVKKGDSLNYKEKLKKIGISEEVILNTEFPINNHELLFKIEKIIYDSFCQLAYYVSPFAIVNQHGYGYWLMHFSNNHVAREVYNRILHENSDHQIHIGGAGIEMLGNFNEGESVAYLFNDDSRKASEVKLNEQLPRLITDLNEPVKFLDFYKQVLRTTPASGDLIKSVSVNNPDIKLSSVEGKIIRNTSQLNKHVLIERNPHPQRFFIFKKTDSNKPD